MGVRYGGWVIREVVVSEFVQKQIRKHRIPAHVINKLRTWIRLVHEDGLETARKFIGYHDEPLKGRLEGVRSIRLSHSWRAYYVIVDAEVQFVRVERVDHHEY